MPLVIRDMPTVRLDCSDVEVDFIVLHRIKGKCCASKGEVVSPEEGSLIWRTISSFLAVIIRADAEFQFDHSSIDFDLRRANGNRRKGTSAEFNPTKTIRGVKAISLIVLADSVWRNPLSSCERN